ncbi:hypothetical protein BFJ66_g17912 [Fusarium oxysporum f. sp. cepae]|uniref:HTH CENPB-type domain-containing protein n=1 Tax=Fusarium oxysporum f. sp. cepae TaxID=396571 RepID=A0A3L6MTN9_FUSOX|nr:hypothetical protein BFJ65_g17670 [Fusarium oxysporum f. sp. cepae]RKK17363.1 hypothetical protein BFJ67_g17704 [Fusarium oxysporum f. sp. cepae]RKK17386.1 hypothetical protein BFJ66_g17912 [Fusarium oxysporum f. sp. cepae]
MSSVPYEARVNLALEAIQKDQNLSIRAAAKIYGVSDRTIRRRRDGSAARHDTVPNSRKLTQLEEEVIVQYVIELCTRSFPPRLRGVEDMANQLLHTRDASAVGKNWASNFVRRRPEPGFKSTTLHDTFVNMAWIWMLTNNFDVEWVEMDPLWKRIHIVEFVEWKPTLSNNGN